jgi:hypothetical protein
LQKLKKNHHKATMSLTSTKHKRSCDGNDHEFTPSNKKTRHNDEEGSACVNQWSVFEEHVWSHAILSFVIPVDYVTICSTCKYLHKCMEQNESYRFCMLLKQSRQYSPYMIPSISFLHSQIPVRLKKLLTTGMHRGKLYLPENCFWVYNEDVARQLMKLIGFEFKEIVAKKLCWFEQEVNDMKYLMDYFHENNVTNKLHCKLLQLLITYEQYLVHIPQFKKDLIRFFQTNTSLLTQLSSTFLECIIKIDPFIVFSPITPTEIKTNRKLVLLGVQVNPDVLQYASLQLRKDWVIVLESVKQKSSNIKLSLDLMRSKQFILHALSEGCNGLYQQLSGELLRDEDVIRAAPTRDIQLRLCPPHLKKDRNFVLSVIKYNGNQLQYADKVLKADKELVLIAASNSKYLMQAESKWRDDYDVVLTSIVNNHGALLEFASDRLRDNETIAQFAIQKNASAFKFASIRLRYNVELALIAKDLQFCPEELRRNKNLAILSIRDRAIQFEYCSTELQNDEDAVHTAATNPFDTLLHVPNKFKNNPDIVCQATYQQPNLFEFASEEMKRNRCIVLYLISNQCEEIYDKIPDELFSDKDFVLKAIRFTNNIYSYIKDNVLKNDREIILAASDYKPDSFKDYFKQYSDDNELYLVAVKKDATVLRYASTKVQSDKDVILAALDAPNNQEIDVELINQYDELRDDPDIYRLVVTLKGVDAYRSELLLNDKQFVLSVLSNNNSVYEMLSQELQNDVDVLHSLNYIPEQLRSNRDFVLQIVTNNGDQLQYASSDLRDTREIVEAAVKNTGKSIVYASEQLRADPEIIILAMKESFCDGIQLLSTQLSLMKQHREIIIQAVKQNGLCLRHIPSDMRCDREIVCAAVKQNGNAVQYLTYEWMLQNRDIVLEAVKQRGFAYRYIPQQFKLDKDICLEAVKDRRARIYTTLPEQMRLEKDIAMTAIQHNERMILSYPVDLFKHTREFVLEAMQYNGIALLYVLPEFASDKEIVRAAVTQTGLAFKYAALRLRRDKELVLDLIKINPEVFDYASIELKTNKNFIQELLVTLGDTTARDHILNELEKY